MINLFRDRYAFLSNFFPCRVVIDGIFYPSAEHAYQSQKTLDRSKRFSIAALRTAAEAKKVGRLLVDIREDWNLVKLNEMERIIIFKFKAPCVRKMLLSTDDEDLIEGNYWGDKFWGICLKTNEGENHLGKILMKVREFYREVDK